MSIEKISKRKGSIKNSFLLAEPNLAKLIQEDKIDSERGLPFRFGVAMDVDLGTAIGKWEKVSDGRVWSLKISSKNAKSINLLYDYFYLPYGATMIIYNSDKTIISGPITQDQNSDGRAFGSDIIIGNSIIVELFEPNYSLGLSKLHINKVVYGYKNISESGPGFGESWSCNIDVVCSPEGDGWQEESDAVAMVIVNGTRMCSGALINNACQDFTPNFLTAFHCLDDGDGVLSQQEEDALQNWVFRFKYKSPTCGGGDNYSYVSMSGSFFRAGWAGSDFALLELNQRPKANSGIRYGGWSRTSSPPSSTVAIHHPAGDVMKISVDNEAAVSHPLTINWGDAPSTPPNSHWLLELDAGTTQGGSSGSPIFDQNQRIVGQLHGGEYGCAPIHKYVGRFDVSWNGNGTNETRLSSWLGTNTTETNTIAIPAILGSDAITGPNKACYYQTAIFNLSNDPLPPNSVFEAWEFSPKLNRIFSSNSSIGVYGVPGAYYGDAWVQATFRNQCNNQIILGERKNFMLYHDFNPGESKLTWSTSSYYGYQPITNFWNSVSTGYVYFRFNDKLINENMVRTSGNAYVYQGDEYDSYDFYIYMPTVNSYNFFNFTGTELCGGESFSQTASFMVSVGGLYKVATNPVSNNTATLLPAIDSQELSKNISTPIVQEVIVKNNMGVEIYHCENSEESINISVPINKKGLFYITLIGKEGWKETHRVIKN